MCVKRDPFSSFSYISCDVLKKIYDFFFSIIGFAHFPNNIYSEQKYD